ncbi:MAG: hypothetical protein RL766_1438 [Bacteroidota bacterium]|jgi:hypothetical protein
MLHLLHTVLEKSISDFDENIDKHLPVLNPEVLFLFIIYT